MYKWHFPTNSTIMLFAWQFPQWQIFWQCVQKDVRKILNLNLAFLYHNRGCNKYLLAFCRIADIKEIELWLNAYDDSYCDFDNRYYLSNGRKNDC